MLSRLSLRGKILLLPSIAALAFLIVIGSTLVFGERNTTLIMQIESGHFPALQIARDLQSQLADLQRDVKDAAAASDLDVLREAEDRRDPFMEAIAKLEANPAAEDEGKALRRSFVRYFEVTLKTSRALILGGLDMDLSSQIQEMQAAQVDLEDDLSQIGTVHQSSVTRGFEEMRRSASSATVLNTSIGISFLIVLLGLSVWTLRAVLSSLGETSGFVSAAAAEILAVSRQTESNANEEAAFVTETQRAMEGLLESAAEISGGASAVLQHAEKSTQASRTIADRISQLNAQALKITDVSELIRGIAAKSDMLALNASLEASKVGDAGRGIALVGSEMRRLAENVTDAVRQIKELANEIREVSQAAVLATEEGQKLAALTTDTSKQISLITGQQRTATEQVTQSMDEIQAFARQARNGAQQARAAAGDLVRSTSQLNVVITGRASARGEDEAAIAAMVASDESTKETTA